MLMVCSVTTSASATINDPVQHIITSRWAESWLMTSSNGNIFRVTGHLCGEFTGHRWIPRTKASDAELWFFSLICACINGWVINRKAGDSRRHHTHYEVTVMITKMKYIRPRVPLIISHTCTFTLCLVAFVLICDWLILPISFMVAQWALCDHTIAPKPVKQPWIII